MFEEQVDVMFKAFNEESFSHQGKHYTIPPKVPYRGYELEEITLVPRPKHLPVECWQPIVSANPRGLDFMVKHGIRGIVGGGSALLGEGPVVGYRDALARAGIEAELGEGICVGVNFYLADSKEQAVARGDALLRGAREDVRAARVLPRAHRRAAGGGRPGAAAGPKPTSRPSTGRCSPARGSAAPATR